MRAHSSRGIAAVVLIAVDKNFDGLRKDPDYQAIMSGVKQRWEEYKLEFDPAE